MFNGNCDMCKSSIIAKWFIVGTVINLARDVEDSAWAGFWQGYVYLMVVVSGIVVLWFAIGGFRDIRAMLGRLAVMRRDDQDDGWVRRPEGD